AQGRDEVADVGVLGTEGGRQLVEHEGDVGGAAFEGHVGADVAEDALPDVAVGVDEPGHHDHAPGVDHLRLVHRQVGSDLADHLAFDEDVGGGEVADLAVEGEDRAALYEDAAGRGDAEVGALRIDGGNGRLFHLAAAQHDAARPPVVAFDELFQVAGL